MWPVNYFLSNSLNQFLKHFVTYPSSEAEKEIKIHGSQFLWIKIKQYIKKYKWNFSSCDVKEAFNLKSHFFDKGKHKMKNQKVCIQ